MKELNFFNVKIHDPNTIEGKYGDIGLMPKYPLGHSEINRVIQQLNLQLSKNHYIKPFSKSYNSPQLMSEVFITAIGDGRARIAEKLSEKYDFDVNMLYFSPDLKKFGTPLDLAVKNLSSKQSIETLLYVLNKGGVSYQYRFLQEELVKKAFFSNDRQARFRCLIANTIMNIQQGYITDDYIANTCDKLKRNRINVENIRQEYGISTNLIEADKTGNEMPFSKGDFIHYKNSEIESWDLLITHPDVKNVSFDTKFSKNITNNIKDFILSHCDVLNKKIEKELSNRKSNPENIIKENLGLTIEDMLYLFNWRDNGNKEKIIPLTEEEAKFLNDGQFNKVRNHFKNNDDQVFLEENKIDELKERLRKFNFLEKIQKELKEGLLSHPVFNDYVKYNDLLPISNQFKITPFIENIMVQAVENEVVTIEEIASELNRLNIKINPVSEEKQEKKEENEVKEEKSFLNKVKKKLKI